MEEWVRSITEQVTIDAPPHDVHAFVASPERLPVWAIGFAKAIRLTDDGWRVTLAAGNEMPVRIDADAAVGTVDFVLEPTPGVEVVAPTRVLANGDGAEYVFTMFQAPDMPDEVFEQQAAELRRELTVLKAHLETACPR